MRIINLIENTMGDSDILYAHGLSFYIETANHKLLMDAGPSEAAIANANKLGIDLSAVDIVILSHGHYDHSGGIIPFSEINKHAVIYMQKSACEDYYAYDGDTEVQERYRYIGIDKRIIDMSQVKFIDGDFTIDDELSLFVVHERCCEIPFTNSRLKQKINGSYIQDSFIHEHFLVISDMNKKILISGCAHNGIINILEEYSKIYGSNPDVVISGFHLMKKTEYTDEELLEIIDTAKCLKKYHTMFYTCHCTGIPAFNVMKNIMGEKLEYIHSGDEVQIRYS